MKKIILLILAVVLFGCTDNPTTAPTKEYPISHKNIAVDLAIKINQIRRLNGLEEFLYEDDANYRINQENTSFNAQTSVKDDDFFYVDDTYELQGNDTIGEYITRWRYYYENTDDLINKILVSAENMTERVEGGEAMIAINIVERENPGSKLIAIDLYVYFIVRDYKLQ